MIRTELARAAVAVLVGSVMLPTSAVALPSFSGMGVAELPQPVRPPGVPVDALDWTPDGQFATGRADTSTPPDLTWQVYRWSSVGGIELLPYQGDWDLTHGVGISDDGRAIAVWDGWGDQILRWDEGEGWRKLTDFTYSAPDGISGDGSRILGVTHDLPWDACTTTDDCYRGWQALVWDESGDAFLLGDFVGGQFRSQPADASFDGSIVVGYGTSAMGREAFVWDSMHGMRRVSEILMSLGVDTSGWSLEHALYVSSDGLTITGTGINPAGEQEAWIAVIPEPSTAFLLGIGLVAIASRRGRR